MFFDLEVTICERFPALSPFQVRRASVYEVCLLTKRLNEYSRKKGIRNGNAGMARDGVIRRPARDDSWF